MFRAVFRTCARAPDFANSRSGTHNLRNLLLIGCAAGFTTLAASAGARHRRRSLQCEGYDWKSIAAGGLAGFAIAQSIPKLRSLTKIAQSAPEPGEKKKKKKKKKCVRVVGTKWSGELVAHTQLPPWQSGKRIPLRVLRLSAPGRAWEECNLLPGDVAMPSMPSEFKVMTFNVWEDHFENDGTLKDGISAWPDAVKFPPSTEPACRMRMIADIVKREKPDLIALQEVTEALVLELFSHPQFDEYYFTSIDHVPTDANCPSGVMLLSRWPLSKPRLYPLPGSGCGNSFVAASVPFVHNGRRSEVVVATFHLESKPTAVEQRREQAKRIGEMCRVQSGCGHLYILSGDTNIKGDGETLDFGLNEEDAWTNSHGVDPSTPGFTRGNGVIPNNIPNSWDQHRDYRMDRIYVAGSWNVQECRVIGTEFEQLHSECPPAKGQLVKVWPSDHAGLVTKLRIKHP